MQGMRAAEVPDIEDILRCQIDTEDSMPRDYEILHAGDEPHEMRQGNMLKFDKRAGHELGLTKRLIASAITSSIFLISKRVSAPAHINQVYGGKSLIVIGRKYKCSMVDDHLHDTYL